MRRLDRRILLGLEVCLGFEDVGLGRFGRQSPAKEVRGTSESIWDFSPSSRGSSVMGIGARNWRRKKCLVCSLVRSSEERKIKVLYLPKKRWSLSFACAQCRCSIRRAKPFERAKSYVGGWGAARARAFSSPSNYAATLAVLSLGPFTP